MVNRRLVITGIIGTVAGCLGTSDGEEDEDDNEDTKPDEEGDEYADIEPIGDIDGFPGHGNMADELPEEIADFPAFVTRLENANLQFEEPEYMPGTGMGLDIMLDSLPETLSDIESELSTLSEAYWAWMIYDGSLKPPDEWEPVSEGNEEYPPLGLDLNFHVDGERAYVAIGGSEEAGSSEIVQYVTGEIGPDQYAEFVAEGTGMEW